MYILNIIRAIKKMSVNETREFFFGNFYKRIEISKKNSYYSMKSLKKRFIVVCKNINRKIADSCNAKEHYQSFIRKKNTKSVKQSKMITYQPKAFENPNTVDIKSVITEHPKTSQKLFKTKNVGSNSPLYSDIKSEKFLNEKNVKITK